MSEYIKLVNKFHTVAKDMSPEMLVDEVVNELVSRENGDDHLRKLRLKLELASLEYAQRSEIESKIDEASEKIMDKMRDAFDLRYRDGYY